MLFVQINKLFYDFDYAMFTILFFQMFVNQFKESGYLIYCIICFLESYFRTDSVVGTDGRTSAYLIYTF